MDLPNLLYLDLSIILERSQLSTLHRLLSSIPNIHKLALSIYTPPGLYGIQDVYDTIFPDTVFRKLESLTLSTNVKETDVCSDGFISRQPSLIELKDSLYSRRLIGTCPTLKALCAGFTNNLLTNSITTDKLHTLSILRLRSIAKIPWETWETLVDWLLQLTCIELVVALQDEEDSSDERACRMLSLFTRGCTIEFGVHIKIDSLLMDRCTSTRRLVSSSHIIDTLNE